MCAAEAIVAHTGNAAAVAARYRKDVRHHLFADHRMSHFLGTLLASPMVARGAIRLVGTNDWTKRNFARWMFEDEPRAAVFTPSRWHRGFLDQDGVFIGKDGVVMGKDGVV